MAEITSSSGTGEPPETPFDRIRHEDEHGEYWLARDLQIVMAYEKWENFEQVIARAIRAAENTNTYSASAFSRFQEPVPTSGNAPNTSRSNYRLSRYAAYLVAMNGDPNKPAVAQGQAYFAIKTREAEVATSRPMSELELARRYVAAVERELALEAELAIAAPKAGKWDEFLNAEGLIGMTELADLLKTHVNRLTAWFIEVGWFRKAQSANGGNRNMPRKGFQDSGHFVVKMETKNGWTFPCAYATASGVDLVVDSWEQTVEGKTQPPGSH